jgi:hypothetical protein
MSYHHYHCHDDQNDLAIAMMLQEEENQKVTHSNRRFRSLLQKLAPSTPVPTETDLDLHPDIRELFIHFDREFFYSSLASVEVKWSNRMTLYVVSVVAGLSGRCAGLCEYHGGGYCVIKLSEKLLQYRSKKELFETLLVCHLISSHFP